MKDIKEIKESFNNEISNCNELNSLEQIRVEYLGKKGIITELLQSLKDVQSDLRRDFGLKINLLKQHIEQVIEKRKFVLNEKQLNEQIAKAPLYDITLPPKEVCGSLHPVTVATKELIDIFTSMGFSVEDGNEVETEYNNFESVNVPKNHPARDMQDTFWLENGMLLKTQTTASQNRIFKKYGAPCRVIFPGKCYRNEALDASHDNTFYQLEGIVVSDDCSISNLIYFMKTMLSKVFKTELQVRLRPGFFPFVEPGFELDVSCPFCGGKGCQTCKNSGWIELCPCGMIHPNVLKMGDIDTTKYRGFAFGLGLTRLAMIENGIKDIRNMNNGSIKYLSQKNVK